MPLAALDWRTVELTLPRPRLAELATTLEHSLVAAGPLAPLQAGQRVAVAVGSRAIDALPELLETVLQLLRARGTQPFLVPAMGSHGGGSADRQAQVLATLGVDGTRLGAELISRPELLPLGSTTGGVPIWCDRAAWEADWIVPINRIKPHTAFRGPLQSGPAKLLAVGLGKERSARALHAAGLERAIPEVLQWYLQRRKVPWGVALVENAWGEPCHVEVLAPATWLPQEERLVGLARQHAPRLPWPELDLVVLDRIGKDIAGTGFDLNVVGMERRFPGWGVGSRARRIVALELSPGSAGNANGVGYADVVTRALARQIDWDATYANCRATGFVEAARLPYVADDAADALAVARAALGADPAELRAVHLQDTGSLARFRVTPALLRVPPADLEPASRVAQAGARTTSKDAR